MQLSSEEARIIGSLVEKQLTTPDQYPLTLKALVAACNQASNRDPVVTYDEHTVMTTLDELKARRLIRFVLPSHGRTAVRYRHILDETLALDRRQCALLAVLLLRGPQTIGELRLRTDRMAEFEGLGEVEHELLYMSSVDVPLTLNVGRRPGQKEERWASPLLMALDGGGPSPDGTDRSADHDEGFERSTAPPAPAGELEELRSEIAALRSEVASLRGDLHDLRTSLGE
jgi:uncharacterized protein YceH (UPF0502 family)